jgi:uncharacterized repeat protein (TIGR01451 family)
VTSAEDTAAGSFQGTLTSTATVNAVNEATAEQYDQASAAIVVQASDLNVTVTADRGSINAGDGAGFTITLTNSGLGAAAGLLLYDPLPAGQGADLVWAVDQGTGDPGAFTITGAPGQQLLSLAPGLGTLAPGGSLSVHVSAATTKSDAPVLNNSALVDAGNEPDAERDKVASATVAVMVPAVEVAQVADRAGINAGELAGFTITVTGQTLFSFVTVSDALPAGLGNDINWQIDSGTGNPGRFRITGAVGSQVLTLAPGLFALGLGQALTVHVTGVTSGNDVDAGTFQGTLSSTVTVNYGRNMDLVQSAQAGIALRAPDVDVSVAADSAAINAGDPAGFTVTVRNDGPGNATGVALSDPLPAGLGNDAAWQIDVGTGNPGAFALTGAVGSQLLTLSTTAVTLAPGAGLTVHITAGTAAQDADPVTSTGTLPNTATVSAGNENAAEQNDQASATVAVLAPDVRVTVAPDKATVNAGDVAGFTVTLSNRGPGAAYGVTLSDPLPAGLGKDLNWQIDVGTGNPGAFTLTGAVGSQLLALSPAGIRLAAGASLAVHVTGVTTAQDADPATSTGTLPNTATVSATNEAPAQRSSGGTITVVASPSGGPLGKGQTATIGFWHNKNGQAVINNFNGGPTAKALGNWLANNFGNLFGGLAGKTNAQVASAYLTAFGNAGGVQGNAYVQSFAVALAIYTTTYSLGGASTAANPETAKFGFRITAAGAGAATYNVGSNGAAFGVANGTALTLLRALQSANSNYNAKTGLFYGGDTTKTGALDNVLDGINQTGDIA